jgi:thiosulfate dehydrogenase [quinone] large subunit
MASSKKLGFHEYLHFILRVALGFTMLWAFVDKLFGLGFATKPENSWLMGGSPTAGFLKGAVKGPFADFYNSLSGQVWVDWLFMMGLLGIGLAFLLGIALRFAGYMGALFMMMLYFALILPENNPIVDDHIVNAIAFLIVGTSNAGEVFGLQKTWRRMGIVKALPFLA